MLELYEALLEDESGAEMAEYGMLLALIAVFLVTAISAFGDAIAGAFNDAETVLETGSSP